jgi:hypothetical protein
VNAADADVAVISSEPRINSSRAVEHMEVGDDGGVGGLDGAVAGAGVGEAGGAGATRKDGGQGAAGRRFEKFRFVARGSRRGGRCGHDVGCGSGSIFGDRGKRLFCDAVC